MSERTPGTSDLAAAFDAALSQVERAIASGMRTRTGEPARPHLEQLRADLLRERDAAAARGRADSAWVGKTVRWVVDWSPETELALIAGLGAIARVK